MPFIPRFGLGDTGKVVLLVPQLDVIEQNR
ncbi:hypothetical protein SPHINGO391_70010 [Sphingomonas aurantiaca]|uniref:Uncharacterized protein n=1 Tax=Sphingomonas aurantiaca TaxID=185949 RepID=A0A5E8ALI7_9SPHN|nr:hypothetical protein SPHINGO391_70010 [Sphingomonas aurantiaca]